MSRGQDFEKAGSLRDKEMELKAQISKITNQAKESEQAEVESGDQAGPLVTEADIANIVAQWTGVFSIACCLSLCSIYWSLRAVLQSLLCPIDKGVGAFNVNRCPCRLVQLDCILFPGTHATCLPVQMCAAYCVWYGQFSFYML